MKKYAKQHRLTYLECKAHDIADKSGTDSTIMYTQLMQRESQQLAVRQIKYTLKRIREGSITWIKIHNRENEWQEVTSKEGIEKGCIQENIKTYHQTENTLCMIHPLREALVYNGITDAYEVILRGTYIFPAEVSQYSKELLLEFKRKDALNCNIHLQ